MPAIFTFSSVVHTLGGIVVRIFITCAWEGGGILLVYYKNSSIQFIVHSTKPK